MHFRVRRIRQQFDRHGLPDPVASLQEQLARLDHGIRPGARIAIAVGSRGISNLALLVKAVSGYVRARDAHPFIVPAMGSHGGATADGQAEVLASYGVSEAAIGSPVRATMEVVELPCAGLPIKVFMDRHAYESDGVILINRIKPHTDYHGLYESGLMKMALIGLGKLEGAFAVHDFGVAGLRELIGPGAAHVLASGRILAGIACVEDAYHETMVVKVLKADEIAGEEPRLLTIARNNMPRLPVDAVDVLVVDRMGKDISGVGIDPNITGRTGVAGQHDSTAPVIKALMVSRLDGPLSRKRHRGWNGRRHHTTAVRQDRLRRDARQRHREQFSRAGQDSGFRSHRSRGVSDCAQELRPASGRRREGHPDPRHAAP